MALKNEYPVIDDRRYADILAEARARIPRYTPEWTDLNDNDPGIAMVQVMAWMSDLLLARLGQVPKLNRLKFLELLGIELRPAEPARVELVFPVLPAHTVPTVLVPLHTQVASKVPGEDKPSIFETERAIVAIAARLDSIQSDRGLSIEDLSPANAELGAGFQPFGPAPRLGYALMLGFDSTLEFPTVPIDLAVWVGQVPSRGPVYVDSPIAAPPSVRLAWDYWNGKDWYPLDTLKDDTAGFERSGHLLLAAPPRSGPQRAALGKVSAPRYWLRARLAEGAYQRPPLLLAVRTNTAPAIAAQTVNAETLGRSNGQPDQVFALAQRPVLAGSLVLEVDEGEGFLPWQEVPDFLGSGPDDPHYVLNRTTGEVRFNGAQGRIPVANPNRPANILARTYRVGGGASGNLGAGTVVSLRGYLPGIEAAAIANPFPSFGGADEETLAQAELRSAQTLKSHERAVTPEDFELHAAQVGGVARAKALPLHHPKFPGVDVPGVMGVIAVPEASDPEDPLSDPAPKPTQGLLRQVCAELDKRRLATVELYVLAPSYRTLAVSATLSVAGDADLAAVKQEAILSLRRYFHPLIGGDDSSLETDGSGWPFGGTINHSRVVQRLLLPGVRGVDALAFTLDGETAPACTNVPMERDRLIDLPPELVQIRVQYEVLA
jgi:predicted phage baseplate assembly protein